MTKDTLCRERQLPQFSISKAISVQSGTQPARNLRSHGRFPATSQFRGFEFREKHGTQRDYVLRAMEHMKFNMQYWVIFRH